MLSRGPACSNTLHPQILKPCGHLTQRLPLNEVTAQGALKCLARGLQHVPPRGLQTRLESESQLPTQPKGGAGGAVRHLETA